MSTPRPTDAITGPSEAPGAIGDPPLTGAAADGMTARWPPSGST